MFQITPLTLFNFLSLINNIITIAIKIIKITLNFLTCPHNSRRSMTILILQCRDELIEKIINLVMN